EAYRALPVLFDRSRCGGRIIWSALAGMLGGGIATRIIVYVAGFGVDLTAVFNTDLSAGLMGFQLLLGRRVAGTAGSGAGSVFGSASRRLSHGCGGKEAGEGHESQGEYFHQGSRVVGGERGRSRYWRSAGPGDCIGSASPGEGSGGEVSSRSTSLRSITVPRSICSSMAGSVISVPVRGGL